MRAGYAIAVVLVLVLLIVWLASRGGAAREGLAAGGDRPALRGGDRPALRGAAPALRGAAPALRELVPRPACHPGHVPRVLAGAFLAYRDAQAPTPCAKLTTGAFDANHKNLAAVEARLAEKCGAPVGWFVADTVTARCDNRHRETYWGCPAPVAGARENFSPDRPGACRTDGGPPLESERAAAAVEAASLLVLQGH